jgi:membrane protein
MDAREDLDMSVITRVRRSLLAPLVSLVRTAWAQVPTSLRHNWLADTTVETITLVRRNRVMGIAAEVSFWAVLSITPLLLVSASTLGWIDSLFGLSVADDAREALTSAVRDILGIGNQAVESIDQLFDSPSAGGLTVGLLSSIYASSRVFTSLIGGLDHIIGRDQKRNFFTTRIAGVVAAVLTVPALVGLLVMINIGRTGFGLPQPWSDIVSALMWPIIVVGLAGFALSLLHGSPAQRTPLRHDILGAAVAVIIWLGGSWVAARSFASFGSDVLGILGGSVGLLFWLYVMTSGILIGAQVNVARHNVVHSTDNIADQVPDFC